MRRGPLKRVHLAYRAIGSDPDVAAFNQAETAAEDAGFGAVSCDLHAYLTEHGVPAATVEGLPIRLEMRVGALVGQRDYYRSLVVGGPDGIS